MFRHALVAGLLIVAAVTPAAHAQYGTPFRSHGTHYHGQRYQVEIRMWAWQERTFSDPVEAREFALYRRANGHEAFLNRHGAHMHVRFRAPIWQTYSIVSSHREAHELARYLEYRGQDARVVHH